MRERKGARAREREREREREKERLNEIGRERDTFIQIYWVEQTIKKNHININVNSSHQAIMFSHN